MNKRLFQKELNKIESQINTVEKLDKVNQHLQRSNWVFIHPYSQGGDIEVLTNLIANSENLNEDVVTFFARKFFDLRGTIHLIEGVYLTRPFLKDFVPTIRESIVMCLQKDFKGAISILIPVIEGTLRKYLINKKGEHKKGEIEIKELLKAVNLMTDEYVELSKTFLHKRNMSLIKTDNYLDSNQEKEILKKHRYYFKLWMIQFEKFIKNNLYLNTKTNHVTDSFNRHLIFHGLEEDIEFSFGNYLRIFNSLNFLSWAIGCTVEGCSSLSELPEYKVKAMWADYFNILITSEAITEYKNNIYTEQVESFGRYMHKQQADAIVRPVNEIKKYYS
ncbi:hypothetical protein CW751_00110 [Brumimicrobium salinarum]|uniref:Uncharacterized protein n=1 Tax=Brumimicrobium salinarum TaxID=2058658 RepID=A0A2I0R5Y8_9FLAO|nr:hypothetical protein [Brumimicrobium salinarum]PKR81780.1 hypothetical protein CW751_00110 [Brumimicrobium salinarum]